MGNFLSGISKSFYQVVYKKNMYVEPALSFMPVVEKHLGDKKQPKKILDAACGYNNSFIGDLIASSLVSAENLTGMDIDTDVVGKNKIHHEIIIQDMHEPMEENRFDGVMSQYTWEHLHTPETVLANFAHTLKKNGKLVIVAPQRYDYVSTIERLLPVFFKNLAWRLLKGRNVMPYPAFFRVCTRKSLEKQGEIAGFKLIEYKAFSAAPLWFQRIPPVFVLACLLMSVFNKFTIFEGLRSTFIAVLEKQ